MSAGFQGKIKSEILNPNHRFKYAVCVGNNASYMIFKTKRPHISSSYMILVLIIASQICGIGPAVGA
jgi:hypothetical protein